MLLMTPGPTNVSNRVMKAMTKPIIGHRGPEFHELYTNIEENLKYTFQSTNEIFILTASGTGGVECAVSNVVSEGDKILVPINGDFSYRLKEIIRVFGGKPVEMYIEEGNSVDIERIRETVDDEQDLKGIAITYNETSTGVVTRCLEDIGKLTKKKNLLLIVDAVSSLAGEKLPVDDWNVDLCVSCSQKSMAAPPGLAFVSVSEKAWEIMGRMNIVGNYYFNLNRFRAFHERKETPYTPAVSLFYALEEALNMLREEGLTNRIARHALCSRALYEAVEAMGLELLADESIRSNTVIAIKNPAGISDKDIREKMLKKHKIAIAGGMGQLRGSTFRIGNMGIVSKKEVIATVNALEDTLNSMGLNFEKGIGISVAERIFK